LPLAEHLNGGRRVRGCVPGLRAEGRRASPMSRLGASARMPEGPWLYPEDQAADIPSRLLASEITREKLYLRLHDELPYASAVETENGKSARTARSHRPGDLCPARGPEGDRAGQRRRRPSRHRRSWRAKSWKICSAGACISFLFVKVRENWAETREHYDRSASNFPETNSRDGMERRRAIVLSARRMAKERHPGVLTREHGRHPGWCAEAHRASAPCCSPAIRCGAMARAAGRIIWAIYSVELRAPARAT
jgi:hypothetical protein